MLDFEIPQNFTLILLDPLDPPEPEPSDVRNERKQKKAENFVFRFALQVGLEPTTP